MNHTKKEREFFEALGRLIWYYSGLDFLVRNSYWALAGTNPSTTKEELSLNFKQVLENALSAVKNRFLDNLELQGKIIDILKRCIVLNNQRNEIIHSSWWTDAQDPEKPYSGLRLNKKFKNVFGGQWNDFTPQEINRIADDIKTVRKEFFYLTPTIIDDVRNELIESIK